ncbi:MAG TPA: amino acid adenylation domain-containing protein, partial [Aquabacterium sp.]|nr:amino acid adenylation domain-containing protein [Aquabacterium sp.]
MKAEDFVDFYSHLSFQERQLARGLLARKGIDFASLPITRRPHDAPRLELSFAQQRLWFLDRLGEGNSSYNIALALRLVGQLDVAALGRTLDDVVQRHEVLRSRFELAGDAPVQVVDPSLRIGLPLSDLCALPEAEREAGASRLAQEESSVPFDLATGPLVRARLVRLARAEHVVLLTLHHIVSDGWSASVLFDEVAALYAAHVEGRPSPLPPLQIQYADFAHWQREWQAGEILRGQLSYWTEQLAGAPALLALPTDRPRPVVQTYAGATRLFEVPAEVLAGLNALAQQHSATLFMTLAAAFDVLLARYSGQRDICIGTPVANRNRPELEPLIGCFVNTLVLRNRVDVAEPFTGLLAQVRDTALGAYAHQDLPFEQLVDELKLERQVSHAPLFQVMLVLQNLPQGALQLPGLSLEPVATGNATAKFDLTLTFHEEDGRLHCAFEYNTDLFDAGTIERMAGHLQALLAGIVADAGCAIGELPMLAQAERRQLLLEWNDTATLYDGPATIQGLFEQQVRRTGAHTALVYEGIELSYEALNAQANRLAHHLLELGVGADVRVGICAERSVGMVLGLLAILKAGGAYVPLDPAYPAERLAYMVQDAAPAVLLTQSHLRAQLPLLDCPVLCLDSEAPAWAGLDAGNPPLRVLGSNLAYVIYTSGSTGRPKGAGIDHAGIVNRLQWMQQAYGLHAADRVLQKTPFSFDVSVWEFFWPLMSGATLVLARPGGHQDVAYLCGLIQAQAVTTLHFVPPMLEVFLNTADADRCRSVRQVMCSGQALPLEVQQRFLRQLPWSQLHNLYGPTEASVDVTAWACRADSGLACVPIGRPIANIQIHVLDALGQPVPAGVSGELHIAGVGLARGYLGRPGLTAQKFVPNPFGAPGSRMYRSGDLVRYLPDGAIEYLGRIDDQVKIRGLRIELGEIEATLAGQPGVRDAVVLARRDVPGEPRLVAYVLCEQPQALQEAALRAALARTLPEYMVPAHFVGLQQFPLSPNGKIDRKALPVPDLQSRSRPYEEPRGELEAMLADVWTQLLQLPRVGRHDNFFELGGHSLLAVTLTERLRKLGLHTTVQNVFTAPTLEALAASVGTENTAVKVPPNLIPADAQAITPPML